MVTFEPGGESDKVHGYIFSESERGTTLFHKNERQIWEIPRSRIKLTKVEGLGDVLSFHILQSYQTKGLTAPVGR